MPRDILIVDDERDIRELIGDVLEDNGYAIRLAANSSEALEALAQRIPALVITDIWMEKSELDGVALLERMRAQAPDLPVLMISGHGTIETAVTCIQKGAYDFIEKPFQEDRLLLVVTRAIEAAALKRENRELRLRASGVEPMLVGDSPLMQQLTQTIARVAPTNSRVLIEGPPGSGKETLARTIHRQSARADGPFIVLSAAYMTAGRVDLALFGAENPDGTITQIGLLEQAHQGTLFIDEIADMPLETQGKVLRALQDQSFERIGGRHRIEVDVRIITASGQDLPGLLTKGTLRQDLYYRLNVVPLMLPALAARRQDIAPLAAYFMERTAEQSGLSSRVLGADALAVMEAYAWPGNVRQLRNTVEWLMIMAPGKPDEPIPAEALPPEIRGDSSLSVMQAMDSHILSLSLREAREIFERHYLQTQIERCNGNISRAAQCIGMERSALHRKLKLLNLQEQESRLALPPLPARQDETAIPA